MSRLFKHKKLYDFEFYFWRVETTKLNRRGKKKKNPENLIQYLILAVINSDN